MNRKTMKVKGELTPVQVSKKNKNKNKQNTNKKSGGRPPKRSNKKKMSAHTSALLSDPYLQTLLDPFNAPQAKIPSTESFKSATFQLVLKLACKMNAVGFGGFALGVNARDGADSNASLIPTDDWDVNYATPTAPYANGRYGWIGQFANIDFDGSTNQKLLKPYTDDSFSEYGDSMAIMSEKWYYVHEYEPATEKKKQPLDKVGVSPGDVISSTPYGIPTLYRKVRLVSAGVTADYTGASLSAKGSFIAAVLPPDSWRGDIAAKTLDDLKAVPEAIVSPINKLNGMTLKYKPLDIVDLTYSDSDIPAPAKDSTGDQMQNMVRREFMRPRLGNEMYCFVYGATANDVVNFTVVLNYEGIPKTSSLNLVTGSSARIDTPAQSAVLNFAQNVPTVHVGSKGTKGLNAGLKHFDKHDNTSFLERMAKPKSDGWFNDLLKVGSEIGDTLGPFIKELVS